MDLKISNYLHKIKHTCSVGTDVSDFRAFERDVVQHFMNFLSAHCGEYFFSLVLPQSKFVDEA